MQSVSRLAEDRHGVALAKSGNTAYSYANMSIVMIKGEMPVYSLRLTRDNGCTWPWFRFGSGAH